MTEKEVRKMASDLIDRGAQGWLLRTSTPPTKESDGGKENAVD